MTGVISEDLALVPFAEASKLMHGSSVHLAFPPSMSSVPRVRSLVGLDRSSSYVIAFACRSVAAFALVGLFSDVSAAAAVPVHWSSFVQGIGSLSRNHFARNLKFLCVVLQQIGK